MPRPDLCPHALGAARGTSGVMASDGYGARQHIASELVPDDASALCCVVLVDGPHSEAFESELRSLVAARLEAREARRIPRRLIYQVLEGVRAGLIALRNGLEMGVEA